MQVYVAGSNFRRIALCDCGWSGVSRWTRGSAEVDAAIHAARTGHFPTSMPMHSNDFPAALLRAC